MFQKDTCLTAGHTHGMSIFIDHQLENGQYNPILSNLQIIKYLINRINLNNLPRISCPFSTTTPHYQLYQLVKMAAAALPLKTLEKIEDLIAKSNGARLEYRKTHTHGSPVNGKLAQKVWMLVVKAASLFPEGTFKNGTEVNIDPYGEGLILLTTEVIWAFSSGPASKTLDCPQRAADHYQFFGEDLYNRRLHIAKISSAEVAKFDRMIMTITDVKASWKLITADAKPRPGLANSPRAAIGAFAFRITNAIIYSQNSQVVNESQKLWIARCGKFTFVQN